MSNQEEVKLVQTKGSFKAVGLVNGIEYENAYREGKTEKGKQYRSVKFGLQTNPTNTIYVELFGMEMDWVYPYSKNEKKAQKTAFELRNNLPQGYHLIGVNVSVERGENGKFVRNSLVDFDAVPKIYNSLSNGDSVWVNGDVEFGSYVNANGEEVLQTKFIIKSIGLTKDVVDFEADNFEETCHFEQEIVVIDTFEDKDVNKLLVNAYTIRYGEKFTTAQFTIDTNENGKLANKFAKLKFGDFIKVYGQAINAVTQEEVTEDEDDDWGGKKPSAFNRANKSVMREMRITGVDSVTFEKAKYTEDDFVVEEFKEEIDESNPFKNIR